MKPSTATAADRLVAEAGPVVKFASKAAADNVLAPIRERYETASNWAYSEWGQADKCDIDMNGWRDQIDELKQQIADRETWIDRCGLDKSQHLANAQQGVDVATPTAELLALAGVHVPPVVRQLTELAPDPDANIRNLGAAHDEYDTKNPEVAL